MTSGQSTTSARTRRRPSSSPGCGASGRRSPPRRVRTASAATASTAKLSASTWSAADEPRVATSQPARAGPPTPARKVSDCRIPNVRATSSGPTIDGTRACQPGPAAAWTVCSTATSASVTTSEDVAAMARQVRAWSTPHAASRRRESVRSTSRPAHGAATIVGIALARREQRHPALAVPGVVQAQQEGEDGDLVSEERQGTGRPDDAEVAVPPDRVLKRMLHNSEGTLSDLAAQPASLSLVTDRREARGRAVVLTDPRDIRALAHPARLAVLTELEPGRRAHRDRAGRPSRGHSERDELSPAGTRARRDRPSRGPAGRRPRATVADDRAEPSRREHRPRARRRPRSWSSATLLDRTRRAFGDWLRVQDDETPEWRDVATLHRSRLWLTVEEAAEVTEAAGGGARALPRTDATRRFGPRARVRSSC